MCLFFIFIRSADRLERRPSEALKIAILLLVLVKLVHGVPIDRFGLNELLVHEVAILAHRLQPLSQLAEHPLMILVHLVELESLAPEPISFLLHINQSGFLFGLNTLNTRLLLQIAHVFLHDVHLLLESCQEVFLVLIDNSFDEHACVLDLIV